MGYFKLKRLKIVEQIGIVFFFAVLIPMIVSGIIINNVNQQAMRRQLRESAVLIANMVSDEIDFFSNSVNTNLEIVAVGLNNLPTEAKKKKYLNAVSKNFENCQKMEIVKGKDNLEKIHEKNFTENKASVSVSLDKNSFLVATYTLESLKDELFQSLKDEARQIYVMTNAGKLIAAHNYTEEVFDETLILLPKNMKTDTPVIFGKRKNQPIVYVHKKEPAITIIVNTTEKITNHAINDNRMKIILSILFATLVIIFVTALYIYYLYINIRQLFKGIIAISKGNYERQIRLLTTVFTPHEIVFLAFEFNRMAGEIHKSYLQLKKNNVELKKLNEFRSNLIDTVSHELRTPLTSIQGYTTRLMRQDIEIDEATKQKSLRIIKEQSERLKHLIEDLLTIPDIEGMRLRTNVESVWLYEVIENSLLVIKNKDNKEIVVNVNEDFPEVSGDKNRLEQVFTNLIENAVKYADPDTKIVVDAIVEDNVAKIYVRNDCEVIPAKKLNTLFEKFIRLDDNTTRTTRGTGLGLFIVKGLIEAMKGSIKLSSTKECGFCVEVCLELATDEVSV